MEEKRESDFKPKKGAVERNVKEYNREMLLLLIYGNPCIFRDIYEHTTIRLRLCSIYGNLTRCDILYSRMTIVYMNIN